MRLKLLLSVFAILFASTFSMYASFPVQGTTANGSFPTENVTTETTVSQNDDDLTSPAASSGKSQVIALILALAVGGLGIHRFYLGYTWQGVVQLLTAGGCGVWALIDLIRIITGDLQPKGGKYSKTL